MPAYHPPIPAWFNGKSYLANNPDVAADPYYSTRPWDHWISSGYEEGRDPNPPMKPEIIAEVNGHSFMCLKILSNGQVMAGTYSFPDPTSKLIVAGHGVVEDITCGESIFRISEIDGEVYLSCEHRKVYKCGLKSNPKDYNFSTYLDTKPGHHQGAFDVQKILGKKIVVGGGAIYTDGHITKQWDNRYYVKQVVEFEGYALVPGYNYDTDRGGWFRSSDGLAWGWEEPFPKYHRPMATTLDANAGDRLFIVGTVNYSGGKHHKNSACIWIYDASGLRLINTFEGYDYAQSVCHPICHPICHPKGSGHVYLGLTRGWKSQTIGCQLVRMGSDGFTAMALFDEAELRGIEWNGTHLLCATRTDMKRGRIYKVSI